MDVISDVAIPIAAILIPTAIAIWLARSERKSAEKSRRLERRAAAAEPVILSLAQFISLDPTTEPMQDRLRELRGRIAVYRAALGPDASLSGDWLGLQHQHGMMLWTVGMQSLGPSDRSLEGVLAAASPGRSWAHQTLETFSGWLAGHIPDETLQQQGAELLARKNGAPR